MNSELTCDDNELAYDLAELSADEWALHVAHGLADELADERQDIYDGEGVPIRKAH